MRKSVCVLERELNKYREEEKKRKLWIMREEKRHMLIEIYTDNAIYR
jgi:hypothetical protein